MDLFILREIAFWFIEVRLQKFCKLLLLELDTIRFNQVRLSISLENFSFFWLNFLTPAFTCSINSMSGDLRNNDRWTQSKSRVWSRGQQFRGFCLGLKHHTVSERLGYVPAAAWRETVGLVQFSVPQVSPLKQKWEHCCALRLGCNVPAAKRLCPFSHLTSGSHDAAWRVRFCMFSWLISQSQHFLMKAREGMKAQLVGDGCRDWSCPIWQQPTDPIIWFVKPQPK